MSLRPSSGLPAACSGDMYGGEPRMVPTTVSRSASGPRPGVCTRPKSSSLATSNTPPRGAQLAPEPVLPELPRLLHLLPHHLEAVRAENGQGRAGPQDDGLVAQGRPDVAAEPAVQGRRRRGDRQRQGGAEPYHGGAA